MQKLEMLQNKNILVMGYALTGKSVAKFLLNHGAHVTINDQGDLSQDSSLAQMQALGARVVDKGHPLSLLDQTFDFIVKNPGIPYHIEFIQEAQRRKIPIYTDVELASWFCRGDIIGITGSNGKTTTTQLIYHLLQEIDNAKTFLAGNIGIPILESLSELSPGDHLVTELSSFQLQGTDLFRPHIAVLLNIFAAHLDYHGSRDQYIEAKLKLINNLGAEDCLIYNYDQEELHDWIYTNPSQKIPFAIDKVDEMVRSHGAYTKDQAIYYRGEKVCELSDIQIPGKHNLSNVLAAICVAKVKGLSNQTISQVLRNYQGMPHRIQSLGEFQERSFYNDSKATNTVATITALKSFKAPVIYLGGGLDRGNDFDDLIPYLTNVKAGFVYGQTKDKLAETLIKAGVNQVETYDNLLTACQAAYKVTEAGQVLLFSPACASWDQFKNFEERGQLFIETIRKLQEDMPYH